MSKLSRSFLNCVFRPGIFAILIQTFGFCYLTATEEKEGEEVQVDPVTGLKMAPNWELVRNYCISCHSPRQFLLQRGTQRTWEEIVVWMQEKAGLIELKKEVEDSIIDYLAQNYGPGENYRRTPIPVSLLPENPYKTEVRKDYEEIIKKSNSE